LSEHDHGVEHIAFSHDEKLFVSISGYKDEGGKIIVWDMSSGRIVASTCVPKPVVSTPEDRKLTVLERLHHTERRHGPDKYAIPSLCIDIQSLYILTPSLCIHIPSLCNHIPPLYIHIPSLCLHIHSLYIHTPSL
jgi:WD40 repeat protein